jgi:hypothetical protein
MSSAANRYGRARVLSVDHLRIPRWSIFVFSAVVRGVLPVGVGHFLDCRIEAREAERFVRAGRRPLTPNGLAVVEVQLTLGQVHCREFLHD